jgi:Protein of unknown function (DUF3089)
MYKINYFTTSMQVNLTAYFNKVEKLMSVQFVLLVFVCLLLAACSKKNHAHVSRYQFKSSNGQPDYAHLSYWAAHPWVHDPSDSLPKALRHQITNDSSADVFFVHPTTFTDKADTNWNALIDDAKLNAKTDYSTILYQASAFNQNTRVFAPRYRQAHYRSFFENSPESVAAFEMAYADIKAAFTYYLSHWNHNKPIIIAAHSQGTVHAAHLLKDFFEGKPLMDKLVSAYLIGMPLPEIYFTLLKPCQDSLGTGCFVGWRSYKKGYIEPDFVAKEDFKSIVTNPLTWKMDTEPAPTSSNTGSVLKNFSKLKKRVTNAQVHGNVLWVRKPKFFGNFLLTTKNYHIADINLFYNNIRQNMAARLSAYLRQHTQ